MNAFEKPEKTGFISGIGGKMIRYILGSVLLLIVLMLTYIAMRTSRDANELADELAMSQARGVASQVQNYFEHALESAFTTANALNAMRNSRSATREDFSELLKDVLASNDEYLAIWSIWEENAFDGKDRQFARNPIYEQTGERSNRSFYKEGKAIEEEIGELDDYLEDYYAIPRSTRTRTIINPYHYSFTGNEADTIFMTSVVIPILENGKSLGVVGVDIELESLNGLVEDLKVFETGIASIVSDDLQIAGHPQRTNVGGGLKDFMATDYDQVENCILRGQPYLYRDRQGGGVLRATLEHISLYRKERMRSVCCQGLCKP